MTTTEALPVRDHMCMSSIDWDFLWQGPQEVMSRFARDGSRVLFIENTGIRRPRLSDAPRLAARLRAAFGGRRAHRVPVPRGVSLLSPLLLPLPWSERARAVNRALLARRLPHIADRSGLREPVVWTFLPNLVALDALRAMRGRRALAVYYCVADFTQLADDPAAASRAEVDLLCEVDLVFAGGAVLARRLGAAHSRVRRASYSVGDAFFDRPAATDDRLAAIPRPRVGYVGGLHHHVDTDLLGGVVRAMPDAQFVFLGPQVSELWSVRGAPNTHFLGQRPYSELPALVDAFDVGLVPYRLTPFTETVWPTKLHEYLARGKPAVSTPLAEVIALGYDPIDVRIAATAHETVDAIRALLASDDRGRERRRALAWDHSWRALIARMRRDIEAAIGERPGRSAP